MKPTSLTINSRCLKAYEQEGLVYPVAPIKEFVELQIKTLNANSVKEFETDDYLPHDLMAFLVKIDYQELSGDNNLQDGREPFSSQPEVQVELATFEGSQLVEHLQLVHGDFLNPIQGLLFRRDRKIQIKANRTLQAITYFCTPVYHRSMIEVHIPDKNQPST